MSTFTGDVVFAYSALLVSLHVETVAIIVVGNC